MRHRLILISRIWVFVAAMVFVLSLGLYINKVDSAAEDSSAGTSGTVSKGGSCTPDDGIVECLSGLCCKCGDYENGSAIGNRCSGVGQACNQYCAEEYNSTAVGSVLCNYSRACNISGGGCCTSNSSICAYDDDCDGNTGSIDPEADDPLGSIVDMCVKAGDCIEGNYVCIKTQNGFIVNGQSCEGSDPPQASPPAANNPPKSEPVVVESPGDGEPTSGSVANAAAYLTTHTQFNTSEQSKLVESIESTFNQVAFYIQLHANQVECDWGVSYASFDKSTGDVYQQYLGRTEYLNENGYRLDSVCNEQNLESFTITYSEYRNANNDICREISDEGTNKIADFTCTYTSEVTNYPNNQNAEFPKTANGSYCTTPETKDETVYNYKAVDYIENFEDEDSYTKGIKVDVYNCDTYIQNGSDVPRMKSTQYYFVDNVTQDRDVCKYSDGRYGTSRVVVECFSSVQGISKSLLDKSVLGVDTSLSLADESVYQASILDIYAYQLDELPDEDEILNQISEYIQSGSKNGLSKPIKDFVETMVENDICYGDLNVDGKVDLKDFARYAKLYDLLNTEDGRLVSLLQFAQNYNDTEASCSYLFSVDPK